MADEDMIKWPQPLSMPLVAWRLLGEYLTVVDYDRLARGQSNVNYTQVAGAILSRFLIDHAHEIRRAAEEVRLATVKEAIPSFYTSAQLAAVASASRTDIPDVYRIGSNQRTPAGKAKAMRSLQRAVAGSKSAAARSSGKPGKVRRRRRKPGAGVGGKQS